MERAEVARHVGKALAVADLRVDGARALEIGLGLGELPQEDPHARAVLEAHGGAAPVADRLADRHGIAVLRDRLRVVAEALVGDAHRVQHVALPLLVAELGHEGERVDERVGHGPARVARLDHALARQVPRAGVALVDGHQPLERGDRPLGGALAGLGRREVEKGLGVVGIALHQLGVDLLRLGGIAAEERQPRAHAPGEARLRGAEGRRGLLGGGDGLVVIAEGLVRLAEAEESGCEVRVGGHRPLEGGGGFDGVAHEEALASLAVGARGGERGRLGLGRERGRRRGRAELRMEPLAEVRHHAEQAARVRRLGGHRLGLQGPVAAERHQAQVHPQRRAGAAYGTGDEAPDVEQLGKPPEAGVVGGRGGELEVAHDAEHA